MTLTTLRAPARWVAVVLAAQTLAGCGVLDDLLTVDAADRVQATTLEKPETAKLLVDGAVADFECAFSHYTAVSGLIGNELTDAQQTAAQWDYDRRSISPQDGWYATSTCADRIGAYTPLATARWSADNALRQLDVWTPEEVTNRTLLQATAAAYAGYAYTLMGEGFCSAAFDAGPELTRAQIFALAETRFTRAIAEATAANNAELLNMARVGRARARLNLGKRVEAAADAALVPEPFVRYANYSAAASRAENTVFVLNNRGRNASVDSLYRNVTYNGVRDPRVPVTNTNQRGSNNVTVIWAQGKYPTAASRIPIARWAEAQLILAEHEVASDRVQAAVDIINRLHTKAGIPAYTGGTAAQVQAQIVQERDRELFLESHHLGDLIRYESPLYPVPGSRFANGGVYGDQRCMPLPDIERLNNPTLTG